jgi:4-hydroxythreonine-4-phosphate dehydrogenase
LTPHGLPTIALTPGEPAGVGPDITLLAATQPLACRLAVVADPELLRERASRLGIEVVLEPWCGQPHRPGCLAVASESLATEAQPGVPDVGNAPYVLRTLDRAIDGCLGRQFDAMVSGPVHKGIINDAGVPFTGHTEYLAKRSGAPLPVMLLIAGALRVALVTTHVALRQVSAMITRQRVSATLEVLLRDLEARFGCRDPRILVCGLNPHAGEGGHLGTEDRQIIAPVVADFRKRGRLVEGPIPADTAFTPPRLAECDAVLAMYHDQGLPVVKHQGFGQAVNVTLGLPLLRTSVDHGTALALAATGRAQAGSLLAALTMAINLAEHAATSA